MKRLGRILYRYWMKFARKLGILNTRFILTIVYFLLMGPAAILFKLIRKDLLDKSISRTSSSWHKEQDARSTLENTRYPF
jgi:hypothetical protein